MKTFAHILFVSIAVTFSANAQHHINEKQFQKRPKMSVEQQAALSLKRMTLALDLSKKQQNQLQPLMLSQASQRKAAMEKRKVARANHQKPTADEIFDMQNQQLDHQIAFKNKMKVILDKTQFEKFEKMAARKKMHKMRKMDHLRNHPRKIERRVEFEEEN